MKKIVVIVFAGLLVSAGLQAQRVYIETDGQGNKKRVILDLTEAAGMPAGAITSDSKTVMFNNLIAQHGAPSATDKLWHSDNQESSTVKGEINATVFEKLEVAPKDMNKAGEIGGTGTMTMNWVEAFNGCIDSDYDNGGWRLPTQRELQMMCIFKGALDTAFSKLSPSGTGIALLSSSSAYYWGATEYNTALAYYVTFGSGYTEATTKPTSYRVRCVRELTN
jgi:hypothetical protein